MTRISKTAKKDAQTPKVYRVEIAREAEKQLDALPRPVQVAIVALLAALSKTPRPRGAKKLKGGEDIYRIRSGDYRIIYQIQDDLLLVLVLRISHRKDAYRRLATFRVVGSGRFRVRRRP